MRGSTIASTISFHIDHAMRTDIYKAVSPPSQNVEKSEAASKEKFINFASKKTEGAQVKKQLRRVHLG